MESKARPSTGQFNSLSQLCMKKRHTFFFVALKQAPTESKSAFLCNGMGSYPNRAVHFNSELATCF